MTDRLAEIRARLDAASWRNPSGWEVGWDARAEIVGVRGGDFDDADLIAHAPADIAWLLDEVERLRNTNLSVANPLCDGGDHA